MKAEEFAKSMIFLNNAYRQEMNQTQVSVWYNFFRDVPLDKFNLAIVRIIEKERYFPTVATIRQEKVFGILGVFINTQRLNMPLVSVVGEKFLPVTAAVVKRIGGFTSLCQSEDIEWRRKSFMTIFKETLDRQKEIAAYSQSQLTEAEKKRNELIKKALKLIEVKE